MTLKRGRARTVAVRGASRTFDEPKPAALTETRRAAFPALRLADGEPGAATAGPGRDPQLRGPHPAGQRRPGAGSAPLVRDTAACRPKPIDLSRAAECDFIGQQEGSLCMLPFPDDYYTVKDQQL